MSHALVIVCLYLFTFPITQAVTRVLPEDSNMRYFPTLYHVLERGDTTDGWWLVTSYNNETFAQTKGNSTSASFSFRGSGITWYTRTGPDNGRALVSIDNTLPLIVDTNSTTELGPVAIFQVANLNASEVHVINVTYDTETYVENTKRFVEILYFEYDDSMPEESTPTTTSVTYRQSTSSNDNLGDYSAYSLEEMQNPWTSTTVLEATDSSLVSARDQVATNPAKFSADAFVIPASTVQPRTPDRNSDITSSKDRLPTPSIIGISISAFALSCVVPFSFLLMWWRRRHSSAWHPKPGQSGSERLPSGSVVDMRNDRISQTPSAISRYQYNGVDPFNTRDPLFNHLPSHSTPSTPRLTYDDQWPSSLHATGELFVSQSIGPPIVSPALEVQATSRDQSRQSRISRLWSRLTSMSSKSEPRYPSV